MHDVSGRPSAKGGTRSVQTGDLWCLKLKLSLSPKGAGLCLVTTAGQSDRTMRQCRPELCHYWSVRPDHKSVLACAVSLVSETGPQVSAGQ